MPNGGSLEKNGDAIVWGVTLSYVAIAIFAFGLSVAATAKAGMTFGAVLIVSFLSGLFWPVTGLVLAGFHFGVFIIA